MRDFPDHLIRDAFSISRVTVKPALLEFAERLEAIFPEELDPHKAALMLNLLELITLTYNIFGVNDGDELLDDTRTIALTRHRQRKLSDAQV